MNSRSTRSHGFASFIAIVSIAGVGLALATLGAGFAWQVRRTQHQENQAQLRQLLLAGAAYAEASLDSSPNAPAMAPLQPPLALTDAAVMFNVDAIAPETLRITVTATLKDDRAQQTLTFRRDARQWRLVNATLDRPR